MRFPWMALLLVSSWFATGTLRAGDVEWFTNLGEAQKAAKEQNRPLMMEFTGSDWCEPCMKLRREVLQRSKFTEYANKNLVLLVVDFPEHMSLGEELTAQNDKLMKDFGVEGLPSVVVLSPEGKKLGQLSYEGEGTERWLQSLKEITK